jgi:hypothetical protein
MKKLIACVVVFFIALGVFAQVPQKMSYQCVVRNAGGTLVVNKSMGIRISILQGTPTGTVVFQESYSPTPQTNANGLVSLEIGGGTPTVGTFSSINWASGPYFLKTETDPLGGTNYTITGISQLLSVPYALYAKDVQNNNDADADPLNEIQSLQLSGAQLSLSKGGGTVAIPGDNWGTQTAVTDVTLTGQGTTASPLKIAQQSATSGQVLKWSGSTWAPAADQTGGGASTPGGSTGSVQFNNGGTFGGDTSLFWDNTNKRLGLGTDSPAALLHTSGTGTGQGNVLFVGNYKSSSPGDPPVSGAGTRLMWYPDKAAFRSGSVTGNYWDKDSIGIFSIALGLNTKAKGRYSTAMGGSTTASGDYSTAMGFGTIASGFYSTAMGFGTIASGFYSTAMGSGTTASGSVSTAIGYGTTALGSESTAIGSSTIASGILSTAMGSGTIASGYYSTAMGRFTSASGDLSTAMGSSTTAPSFSETVIGSYNTMYSPLSAVGWNPNDRLFVIGNGNSTQSNALTVLKNGNIGIGTDNPTHLLDIAGNLNLNSDVSSGIALYCNSKEALWFDGTYFSWGFGASSHNYFDKPIAIGGFVSPGANLLVVNGAAAKPGGGSWATWSDIRLKDIHGNYEKGLKEITSLQPVKFTYKEGNVCKLPSDQNYVGFIAQEVQNVFPEAVSEGKDGYLTLDVNSINIALVNAIKELKVENDILRARLEKLENIIEANAQK